MRSFSFVFVCMLSWSAALEGLAIPEHRQFPAPETPCGPLAEAEPDTAQFPAMWICRAMAAQARRDIEEIDLRRQMFAGWQAKQLELIRDDAVQILYAWDLLLEYLAMWPDPEFIPCCGECGEPEAFELALPRWAIAGQQLHELIGREAWDRGVLPWPLSLR